MNYYLVHQGKGNKYAKEAFENDFVGVRFFDEDLTGKFPNNWRDFNKKYIPIFLKANPEKSKVAAGLGCGTLWTVAKGMLIGDRVLNPLGDGTYAIGEVTNDYKYVPSHELLHQRPVKWVGQIRRDDMSEALKNSSGSINTAFNLSKHSDELDGLIHGERSTVLVNDDTVEDPSVFALEKHLEDFLVHNWEHTELGKKYQIYEQDGEIIGQQYPSDTGPIDILAISKNKKEILVVELKKGRISDVVVGQVQRYMGYVQDELAEKDQTVKGVIIALEDDLRLRRALSVTQNIEFMTYEVKFKLNKK